MINIINYGMGNLGSIQNMLHHIGVESLITNNKDDIAQAEKIILPGVGSFDQAMHNIKDLDLIELLKRKALADKVPFLGICLGMQLLTHTSEEGTKEGLGFFDANVKRFSFTTDSTLKIPHMGWNIVKAENNCELFNNMPTDEIRFYFVHSYHVICNQPNDIAATAHYGYDFTCAIQKENIFGVQFHPEKSHKFGMQLLTNFINYA